MRLRRIDDGHLTTECGSCELRRREDGRWIVDGRVVDMNAWRLAEPRQINKSAGARPLVDGSGCVVALVLLGGERWLARRRA